MKKLMMFFFVLICLTFTGCTIYLCECNCESERESEIDKRKAPDGEYYPDFVRPSSIEDILFLYKNFDTTKVIQAIK